MSTVETPPLPITEACVECGKKIEAEEPSMLCGYCLGSVCSKCMIGHHARMEHPDIPDSVN